MRTEIRMSTSTPASENLWIWRIWDQGRLIARGQSGSEEEARQAVRAATGHDPVRPQDPPTQARS